MVCSPAETCVATVPSDLRLDLLGDADPGRGPASAAAARSTLMMIASPATRRPLVDLDHAADLAAAPSTTLPAAVFQLLRVVAEQLDLDRLRHGGQIADQILHQLRGFDLQPGHLRLDLVARCRSSPLRCRADAALQPDEEIALVGLGQAAAELNAGAPRIARHFGRLPG